MSDDNDTLPGLNIISNLLRLQTQAVERHLKAVNDVWNNVLDDVSAKTLLQGYSKLTQVSMENAKILLQGYSSPFTTGTPSTTDCPNVIFTIDSAAESGGDPRAVPLPANANGDLRKVEFQPPLVSVTNEDILQVSLSDDKQSAVIAIRNLKNVERKGTHTALVYLDSKPPPKLPVAVVIVTFV